MPDRLIYGIDKDTFGFLWLGTRNGLARSNGQGFRKFNSLSESLSLSDNHIEQLSCGNSRYLTLHYAQTSTLRTDVIQVLNGSITPINIDSNSDIKGKVIARNFKNEGQSILLTLSSDSLYIYSFDFSDMSYHLEYSLRAELFKKHITSGIPGINICYTRNAFWIRLWQNIEQNFLLHIDLESKRETVFSFEPSPIVPYSIKELKDGRIIANNQDGEIVEFDQKTMSFKPWDLDLPKANYQLYEDEVGNILLYPETEYLRIDTSNIWLITQNGEKRNFNSIFEDTDRLFCIYSFDLENQIHLGTDRGYEIVTLYNDRVRRFPKNASSETFGISGRGINRIDSMYLLFTSENQGFHVLNTKNGQLIPPSEYATHASFLNEGFFGRDVLRDTKGRLWGKSDPNTIFMLDAKSEKTERFYSKNAEANLAIDGKNQIYIIGYDDISKLNPSSKIIEKVFDYDNHNPLDRIRGQYGTIFNDSLLWICTSNGLLKFNTQSYVSEFYYPFNNKKERIALSTIAQDEKGRLWVGTLLYGLFQFDPKKGEFTRQWTTKEGLSDNSVAGILDDWNGRLWISTFNGISCYTPETNEFINFYPVDGFNHSEFNRYSFYKDEKDSLLYFGGMNGFNAFSPSKLLNSTKLNPTLRFDHIRWYDADLKKEKEILFHESSKASLVLPPDQQNVTISFSLMDDGDPAYHQFSYQIKKLNDEWIYLGGENIIRLNYLPAGTHQLIIRGRNRNGVWSKDVLEIQIKVIQFWYWRWWAFLLYAGLITALLYTFYRYNLRRRLAIKNAEQLKEISDFKDNFFTNITHEFRTPLTIIIGASDVIKSGLEKQNNKEIAKLKNQAEQVHVSGQNLLTLVDQILNISKNKTTDWKLELVKDDVVKFIKGIASNFETIAELKKIEFKTDYDQQELYMNYDPKKLQMILHNLLSNAFKFTPENGEIHLQCKTYLEPDRSNVENKYRNHVHISVKDTGIGILPKDQEKIFDKYYRSDESEDIYGSGIGLFVVKELVDRMEGQIKVESTFGNGSEFSIYLPIKESEPIKFKDSHTIITENNDIEETNEKGVIDLLIIEDNPQIANFLKDCLEEEYHLSFAHNGEIGVAMARKKLPDIIISDVMMPVMDGLEVCNILKNNVETNHIPIVLLTAKSEVEDRISGLKEGADAYLSKPFNVRELKVVLENLLRKREDLRSYYLNLIKEDKIEHEKVKTYPDYNDKIIQESKTYVLANIENPNINGEEIAQHLNLTYWTYNRKIAALTGFTPNKFIRSIRLEQAQRLLETKSLNVSEVAFAVGFKDPKYFSRVFSETYGESPTQWREEL